MGKNGKRNNHILHVRHPKADSSHGRHCISRKAGVLKIEQRSVAKSKVEDSGYPSSTDSNGSNKKMGNCSESDDTESICDGASESGAESIGTDSVFFGSFHKLSEMSKSIDSGVDVVLRSRSSRNDHKSESGDFCRTGDNTESFVTVLSPSIGCRKKNLVIQR